MDNDDHSMTLNIFGSQITELVNLLKLYDVNAQCIVEFLNRNHNNGYIGEPQCVLDVKELLDNGLIR